MLPVKSKIRMHSVAGISILMLLMQLSVSCKNEKSNPGTLPRIKTTPVTNITESGATFNAEVYSLGAEPLTEHGFVWTSGKEPTIGNDKVFLGPVNVPGIFSADIKSALSSGVEYTVRSFVQSADYLYYGIPVNFKSMGSAMAEVLGFKPDSAGWGDTIIVSGRNFSWQTNQNTVRLNQLICRTVMTTDTSIYVIVDDKLTDRASTISVELGGKRSSYDKKSFILKTPQFKDFTPSEAMWGEQLFLTGKYLKAFGAPNGNVVKLGSFPCKYVGVINDSTIIVEVPPELDLINSSMDISINGFHLQNDRIFTLKPPIFTGYTPHEGTWATRLTLTGRFNSLLSRTTVLAANNPTTIYSFDPENIGIYLPYNIADEKIQIIYKVPPFEIAAADSFYFLPPVINSFSPLSGPVGTMVTISGENFGGFVNNSIEVKFGNYTGTVLYNYYPDPSILYVNVPEGLTGQEKISVRIYSRSVISDDYFTVTYPSVSRISPLTGTFNDEITIDGENLVTSGYNTQVNFSDDVDISIPAEVVSSSQTRLIVRVPIYIDSIPRRIGVIVGKAPVVYPETFILSPPEIISVSPSASSAGQVITITGKNFHPLLNGNSLLIGGRYMNVLTSSPDQLTAQVPWDQPTGTYRISVEVGHYLRYSPDLHQVN